MNKVKKFHQACLNIIDNKNDKALNYAVNYAKYGLLIKEPNNEMKTQAMYILSNITYWRHSLAKETRILLKEVIKQC